VNSYAARSQHRRERIDLGIAMNVRHASCKVTNLAGCGADPVVLNLAEPIEDDLFLPSRVPERMNGSLAVPFRS
jgi:hypothetical protein